MDDMNDEMRPVIKRLSRDLVKAAATLSTDEARFLVDSYYQMQTDRQRAASQVRSMEKKEPHITLSWLQEQSGTLEKQIQRALQSYAEADQVGQWMMGLYGIGPIIAAGMLAHIDMKQAPTVGHIWRYAGLDPTDTWGTGEKRPWNASLKTLCWKTGQSFMKFSNAEECVYGHMYKERKEYEIKRNESGNNKEAAANILKTKNFKKNTEAYKYYIQGKLPPAHIDARARRHATKIFLSHLHAVWFWVLNKKLAPRPYMMEYGGHVHYVPIPNADLVPGLEEALRKEQRGS